MSELFLSDPFSRPFERRENSSSPIMNIFRPFGAPAPARKCSKISISAPTVVPAGTRSPVDVLNASPVSWQDTNPTFLDVLHDYLPNDDTELRPSTDLRPLNVYRGEMVRLIAKADNNLVLVRLVNRLGQGLVPLRCLAINEKISQGAKVLADKLSEKSESDSSSSTLNYSEQASADFSLSSEEKPLSLGDIPSSIAGETMVNDDLVSTVTSCRVVNITIRESRVWYRTDCVMRSGHRRILCRYYQDFYSLQLQLLDGLRKDGKPNPSQLLPTLPSPTTHASKENILTRCELFSVYLNALFQSTYIPQNTKREILVEKWLSPRPGDIVKTPRGSFYKLNNAPTLDDEGAWEHISPDALEETIAHGTPFDHSNWSTEYKGLPTSGMRQRSASLLCLSPAQRTPKPFNKSAPTTPLVQQPSMFSQGPSLSKLSVEELPIKVKILHEDDCYVSKCSITELRSFDKLYTLIHSKLEASLPSVDQALTIYHKDEKENFTPLLDDDSYQKVLSNIKRSVGTAFNTTSNSALNKCKLTFQVKF
ncbi:LAFE_0F12992g1_1 [Lachancea fermentati]|uniref:LAFE_0F12992g1_1 n=1 Tax=Lachancea fermentati TaxID=4955 RepID=A0A1G4MFS3_LACFM|nr:LAFE_0F12992g1_1 [Lachancea fermentati]